MSIPLTKFIKWLSASKNPVCDMVGKSTTIILKIQSQTDTAVFTQYFLTLVRKIRSITVYLLKFKSEHTFNIFGQQRSR